jgi:hypothetical protein
MNNVEVLNTTVETIANVNSELSEEQLDNVNAGFWRDIKRILGFSDPEPESKPSRNYRFSRRVGD